MPTIIRRSLRNRKVIQRYTPKMNERRNRTGGGGAAINPLACGSSVWFPIFILRFEPRAAVMAFAKLGQCRMVEHYLAALCGELLRRAANRISRFRRLDKEPYRATGTGATGR